MSSLLPEYNSEYNYFNQYNDNFFPDFDISNQAFTEENPNDKGKEEDTNIYLNLGSPFQSSVERTISASIPTLNSTTKPNDFYDMLIQGTYVRPQEKTSSSSSASTSRQQVQVKRKKVHKKDNSSPLNDPNKRMKPEEMDLKRFKEYLYNKTNLPKLLSKKDMILIGGDSIASLYNFILLVNTYPNIAKEILEHKLVVYIIHKKCNRNNLFLINFLKYKFPEVYSSICLKLKRQGQITPLIHASQGFRIIDIAYSETKFNVISSIKDFASYLKANKNLLKELFLNPILLEKLLFQIPPLQVISWLDHVDKTMLKKIVENCGRKLVPIFGGTLVHFGVILNNLEFLTILKLLFPDLFLELMRTENKYGLTPLDLAKAINASDMIVEFLEANVDINSEHVNENIKTIIPLTNVEDIRSVKLWVENNADEKMFFTHLPDILIKCPYSFTYFINTYPDILYKIFLLQNYDSNYLIFSWKKFIQGNSIYLGILKRYFKNTFNKIASLTDKRVNGLSLSEKIYNSVEKFPCSEDKKRAFQSAANRIFNLKKELQTINFFSNEDFNLLYEQQFENFKNLLQSYAFPSTFYPLIDSSSLIKVSETHTELLEIILLNWTAVWEEKRDENLLHVAVCMLDERLIAHLKAKYPVYFMRMAALKNAQDLTPLELAEVVNSSIQIIELLKENNA